jgi:enamine deaminase RidA (YjgF/YER057c/UK114 family)
MTRDAIATDKIAAPVGPFSLGVRGAGSQAYREHFAEPFPARTAICVAALPLGAAVEMDVVVG